MMQSHPFLVCLQCPPMLVFMSASEQPYHSHGQCIPPRKPLGASARHYMFHSFSVLFACVPQCFLSPVGSFAIVHQRLDTAHKIEIMLNTLAAHTASLTLCVRSPRTRSILVSAKESLEKASTWWTHVHIDIRLT